MTVMKTLLTALLLLACTGSAERSYKNVTVTKDYVKVSQDLLTAVKQGGDYSAPAEVISSVSRAELAKDLDNDAARKAFWINLYNAYIQIILTDHPERFEDRDDFFSREQVPVAGETVSFDLIEHGIIRRSKIKISGGFLNKLFPGDVEKQFRVDEVDPRIHFALNCGAASCPKVAIYCRDIMDAQLDEISKQFLARTTEKREGEYYVTRLISWFRGDFGGLDGAVEMLKGYGVIPEGEDAELEFKPYDWTLKLNNYTELEHSCL